ncbi:LytR/AlgR family response regulator transcription factor [Hymenobacter yonginensis]|uniref:LytTR family DNA-binding domain-containing protein n=1 Tax=Hymenobacter yonginensis TaxID=748197 RepID=A0ABY7PVK6_9BACT|nr:LytTR family DNA-binding domain-containing protein [Hymenobacter yonginensis]WBO86692.1 LytTR family DNA-binding domain-containing protein [Hymenobacter yonginensis]
MPAPTPLTCVIVDDNTMNRLTLEQFVRITEGLEVQASLADPVALLPLLEQEPLPHLLLLDIEMPQLTGLELVKLLPTPGPEVVLVTSHAQFAVDAFALRVTDYLLKPLEYARFLQAVARVRERLASHAAVAPATTDLHADDHSLFIRTNNKLLRLDFDQVLYIEAMSAYCTLVTATRKHIVHATLKALDEQLPFAHFLRVHRSYMVNTRLIDSVADGHLQLGSFEVPIGKSYEQTLMARLRSL